MIKNHLDNLMVQIPPRVYLSEITKGILVVAKRNVSQAQSFFKGLSLKMFTDSRYLVGYIGTPTAQAT